MNAEFLSACVGVGVCAAALAAKAVRDWRDDFESACRRTNLPLTTAAICMGVDAGQLRRQLDAGSLSPARLYALPPSTLEMLLALIAERA